MSALRALRGSLAQSKEGLKEKKVIELSIMGDTQCYWSFIGKRRVDAAMNSFPGKEDVLFKVLS